MKQRYRKKRTACLAGTAALLALLMILAACGAAEPSGSSVPAPEAVSSSGGEAEEAPPPSSSQESSQTAPSQEAASESSAPEVSQEASSEVQAPSSASEAQEIPDVASSQSAPVPVTDSREFNRGKANRDGLQIYLEETLTTEQYTGFYYTEDQMGLGIATPDVETVKAAVEAYGYPEIPVEYRETAYSRAVLDRAREELRALETRQDQGGDRLIINVSGDGIRDGYIHIAIHEMNPALEQFLEESPFGGCFKVEVTGGEPLFNPDT